MASGVNDRQRRSKERAGHASCSQFTGYTEQAGASGDSEVSEDISRAMEESLVFMLGIRGVTTKSHSMGSRHPCETEITGGGGEWEEWNRKESRNTDRVHRTPES